MIVVFIALALITTASPTWPRPRGAWLDPHTERHGIIVNQHIFDTLLGRDTLNVQADFPPGGVDQERQSNDVEAEFLTKMNSVQGANAFR